MKFQNQNISRDIVMEETQFFWRGVLDFFG